ncbi:hypothetical protein PQX77_011931 [Marasmius sp. AFHP31]|nr:hypothetical protein PQX77_011931 [Marasmius sp. AFHP31]
MESVDIKEPLAGLHSRPGSPKPSSPLPSVPFLPVGGSDIDEDQSPTVCSPRAKRSISLTTPSIPRDPKYYIDEKMVVLHVDNTLFRAHRHLLRRESDVFEHMFSSPQPAEGAEGESDDNPIVIPDVTRAEFVALMDYLYEGSFFKDKAPRKTSPEEYINLLSIATRFVCIEARQEAIKRIESYGLNPIQKLVLADTYDIPQWLMPSYIELCKRDNPLTPDEALWIGAEKAMSIAKAREIIRSSPETRQMPGWANGTTWPSEVFQDSRVQMTVNEALLWNIQRDPSPVALGKKNEVKLENMGATRKWGTSESARGRKKKHTRETRVESPVQALLPKCEPPGSSFGASLGPRRVTGGSWISTLGSGTQTAPGVHVKDTE